MHVGQSAARPARHGAGKEGADPPMYDADGDVFRELEARFPGQAWQGRRMAFKLEIQAIQSGSCSS